MGGVTVALEQDDVFHSGTFACDRLSMVSGTFAGDRLGIVNPVERSGQAEKNGNCPVQAGHVGGRQVADGFAEPAPG